MCISDWSSDVCSSDLKPLLMRALANLLSNSYQYSDRGGARIALAREGERATITVADTGRGMPPDVMARLNDDAAVRLRADESGQGSGSGFRSARRLVEALSGSLRIAASSAEGTTIRIALPCAFAGVTPCTAEELQRSEEHTSELQS